MDERTLACPCADTSQFHFRLQGLPDDTFSVLGFESEDHGLSRDYTFKVELETTRAWTPGEVVGKAAVLELAREGGASYVHGVVERAEDKSPGPDGRRLEIILRSPLHRLVHTVQSRVFLGRRIDEIAEEVLRGGGFQGADYELRLRERYPAREHVVQYNESDYAFLLRQLTWWGLWWFFEQDENGARLIITDHNGAGGELAGGLVHHARSGTVRGRETVLSLGREGRLLTEAVSLADYNDRTPEAGLEAEARRACGPEGCGRARMWGSHHGDLDEGMRLARLRREALDCRREAVVAVTDSRGLAPGLRVNISGHGALDGDYLVVALEHEAGQASARPRGPEQKGPTYANEAVLLRLEVPYRTPPEREDIQIPRPPASFTAKVESTGGDYAHLDEAGRYRIRLPFDSSGTPAGQASHPVRMMQPFVGAGYGFHFPLRPGTEVLVGCINGDLDRPVILGGVHNGASPSPVTAANASQHILRTAAGHELLMEDRRGEERIELFTRERRNRLVLDAKEDGQRVELACEEGEMVLRAGRQMLAECGGDQTTEVGGSHRVVVEGSQTLVTKNEGIELAAGTELLAQARTHVRIQAREQDLGLSAGTDLEVEAGRHVRMQARRGDLTVKAVSGSLRFRAARTVSLTGSGGGVLHMGQAGGLVEISTGGDVLLKGTRVTIEGSSGITLKAPRISEN